mgnify:CR=1 FL=1
MLEHYEQSYQKSSQTIDKLATIFLSKVNQEKIAAIKKNFEEWHAMNVPRVKILAQYGKGVNDPTFEQYHPAEHVTLNTLTQESAVHFDTLVEQLQSLTKSVEKTNFARLDTDEWVNKIALVMILMVVSVAFMMIARSIHRSVAEAQSKCEQMR